MDSSETASLANRLEEIDRRLATVETLAKEIRQLVGPFGTLLPDGRMLVQTLHGIKLYIDPLDLIMAPNLIVYRQWEADITALLRRSLEPDTVFVDVGANIGYFTCLAASTIGPGGCGKVIAIEPNPACLELLDANLVINWSMCEVEVHRLAVSNFEGTARLALPPRRAANAHLQRGDGLASNETCEVQVFSLDRLFPSGLCVDLMKIDVEGYEWFVLDGARRVIEESPRLHVVMEWSLPQMSEAEIRPEMMFDLFASLGLVPYRLPASLHHMDEEATRYPVEELAATRYANIVLARSAG
jgi:FkbM family methyltransferase